MALAVSAFVANLAPHEAMAVAPADCLATWNGSAGYPVVVTGGDCTISQGADINVSNVIGMQIIGTLGAVGTVSNARHISSNNLAVASSGTVAAFINANGGYLGGQNGFANATSSSVGALINNVGATINAAEWGVSNSGSITLLRNDGSINGGIAGIYNIGSIGTLVNNGTISGGGGTIGGGAAIANNVYGSIGSIVNTGLISSPGIAILSGYSPPEGASLSTITNTGVIAGAIGNTSPHDMTIIGGTGTVFGTLTGANGTIGAIDNARGNLTITGNQVLNDHVNLVTFSSKTLFSEAGNLRVDNPLTIIGNYTLRANGTLLIGVSSGAMAAGAESDTGYGRLMITDGQIGYTPGPGPRQGDVTLEPGATVKLTSTGSAYAFAKGQRFVVIQATGTANYNVDQLTYGIVGSRYSLSGAEVTDPVSGNHDLVLRVGDLLPDTVAPPGPGGTAPAAPISPTTRNAIASLGGLRSYTGVSDPGLLNLYNASLALGSTAEANRAGAQLSPTQQLAASRAAAAPIVDAMNLLGTRIDGLRIASGARNGIATGDGTPDYGVWGQAFGGHASQGMVDDIPGYSANYGGLLVGIDRALNERWTVGGAFSYSHTRINGSDENAGSTTQVNGYGLLGYASYAGSPWYVNLSGGVVQQRYNTTRVVDFTGFSGTANGAFTGQQYVARTEMGYPLPLGSATLTPLVSLTYSYLHQSAYTETGGNGAALAVGSAHAISLRSALGARLEKAVATRYGDVVPFVQLQWIHEFVNSSAVTGASYAGDVTGETAFTTVGATPVRDLANFTLGVTLMRSNLLSLTARYEVQAGSRFVSQTGSLRLQQRF
ncbi:autotransporter domain-containing protein [Pandoraea pnomenusa]|uniref:autotransporter family protein n=1 Tax=Pandoraea pnomenusa TaxID=93220 RepID=UPI003340ED79